MKRSLQKDKKQNKGEFYCDIGGIFAINQVEREETEKRQKEEPMHPCMPHCYLGCNVAIEIKE